MIHVKLDDIIKQVKQLPALPNIMGKIMQLAENPKTTAKEMTKVIQYDQALSLKVLKLVNSPYYGFPREISTITHAVVILGFNNIKNLALEVSVFDFFKENEKEIIRTSDFWKHSIGTGIASKILADKKGYADSEEIFTIGMLHDVGKLILAEYLKDDYMKVFKYAQEKKLTLWEAENEMLDNINHCKVGSLLAEKWKLPIKFVSAIALHHNPVVAGKVQPEIAYVHAGNVFCQTRNIGFSGNFKLPQLRKEVWDFIGLLPEEVEPIKQEIEDEISKTEEFMKMSSEI